MKKKLAVGLAFVTLLAGCGNAKSATSTSATNDTDQQAQLGKYEAVIAEQQTQIDRLTAQLEEIQQPKFSIEDYIFVFQGDETASFIYPDLIPFDEDKQDLVEAIHDYVTEGYQIKLNSYRFEDDGQLLLLDYDQGAERVQGSAGTYIFLQAMQESYYANFPKLRAIKLLKDGDGSIEVIGESGTAEPFIREPFAYEPPISW